MIHRKREASSCPFFVVICSYCNLNLSMEFFNSLAIELVSSVTELTSWIEA